MPVQTFPEPTTAPVYAFRLRFTMGASGWAETYLFAAKGGTAALLTTLQDFTDKRRAFLSPAAAITGASAAPVAVWDPVAGRSVRVLGRGPIPLPNWTGRAGTATVTGGDPADAVTSLNVRLTAGQGRYARTYQFRGVPASALQISATLTRDPLRSGAVRDAVYNFVQILKNNPGSANGTFVLRGRSHNPLQTLPMKVKSAARDVSGCYTNLTMAEPTDVYSEGDPIHLHNIRGCGVKGLNGDARVVAASAPNILTVSKRNCCCGAYTIKANGEVYDIVYAYYDTESILTDGTAPTPATGGGSTFPGFLGGINATAAAPTSTVNLVPIPVCVSKRNTGRQRASTRGRARKRCRAG